MEVLIPYTDGVEIIASYRTNYIGLTWIKNNGLKGNGAIAILKLIDISKDQSLDIILSVINNNEKLIEYYEELGFIVYSVDVDTLMKFSHKHT